MGPGLDAKIDERFGRARYFTIVDTETMEHKSLENPSAEAISGAGPQSAQMVADESVDGIVTGNVGPNAMTVLKTSGIKVYVAIAGTVLDAVDRCKTDGLEEISDQRVRF
jgi:predicted Fe-Mo cluster-binding NifX family protein